MVLAAGIRLPEGRGLTPEDVPLRPIGPGAGGADTGRLAQARGADERISALFHAGRFRR